MAESTSQFVIPDESYLNSEYTRTLTNFAGADMVAMINDVVFSNIQAITYGVRRELAPIYVMGNENFVGTAKNKRAISGTLVFIMFDRDALIEAVNKSKMAIAKLGWRPNRNIWSSEGRIWTPTDKTSYVNISTLFTQMKREDLVYADQIPPFDITVTMANEYGHAAQMAFRGVQIWDEGMGLSIDDLVMEKACTFICSRIDPLRPISDTTTV